MVAPFTGPFTRIQGSGFEYANRQTWHRQKRPYDTVLPYENLVGTVTKRFGLGGASVTADRLIALAQSPDTLHRDKSWNKARNRWLDAIGETAGLGIDLAQGRQAMGMMSQRLSQLVQFNRGLRNLDVKLVSRSLGIPERRARHVMQPYDLRSGLPQKVRTDPFGHRPTRPLPDVHARSRGLADLWLEFVFGWKPLVSDIFQTLEVLDAPFKSVRTKGSANTYLARKHGVFLPATEVIHQTDRYKTVFGGDVSVTNPNLRLAQQLGILNPATIAFDAIPWSFVFGWFCNIQDYLSSFTDFAGLTINRGYIVQETTSRFTFTWEICEFCSENDKILYAITKHEGFAKVKSRTPLGTIPRPRVHLSTFQLSPTRALTAISLLVQKLPQRSSS